MPHLRTALTALLVACLSSACVTTLQSSRPTTDPSGWLEPSPALRAQIEDEAKRLPWTHGLERVEAIPGFDATVPPHWLEGVAPYAPRWA